MSYPQLSMGIHILLVSIWFYQAGISSLLWSAWTISEKKVQALPQPDKQLN